MISAILYLLLISRISRDCVNRQFALKQRKQFKITFNFSENFLNVKVEIIGGEVGEQDDFALPELDLHWSCRVEVSFSSGLCSEYAHTPPSHHQHPTSIGTITLDMLYWASSGAESKT